MNLVSLGLLEDQGCRWSAADGRMIICRRNGEPIISATRMNGVYHIDQARGQSHQQPVLAAAASAVFEGAFGGFQTDSTYLYRRKQINDGKLGRPARMDNTSSSSSSSSCTFG
ncbi:hypothetical protein HXX76_016261 [Chlamydomonas incerta]|uniref:Uncharacterized protein n=1 Tax=Chlamydomonas incerta TaxID=51695 RepID=A0A835SK56_CHLIN|nr:hypothetical protein HXX76_016261 [Chlamydomonas incerta]|eukprot:KAG2422130.1 hypothetical protein HXX76_016261 [Chlamydomonas incerta]